MIIGTCARAGASGATDNPCRAAPALVFGAAALMPALVLGAAALVSAALVCAALVSCAGALVSWADSEVAVSTSARVKSARIVTALPALEWEPARCARH